MCAALGVLASCSRGPSPDTASAPQAPKGDTNIVATVAGRPITFDAVRETAGKNGYDIRTREGLDMAVRDAVNFEILAEEAKRLGYFDAPEIQQMVKSLAVQKLVKERVDKKHEATVLSEADLRGYYDAHQAEYAQPGLARGQLLFVMRRPTDEIASSDKIEAVKKGIAEGRPFESLVKEYSDHASAKADGGITGWITEGSVHARYPKEAAEALFRANDTHAVAGPIETPQGWYFARLVEKREGRQIPFEQAKRAISQRLYRDRRLAVYDTYVDGLRRGIEARVDGGALRAAAERIAAETGPPMGPVTAK